MMGVNRVIVVGRLGQNPDVRFLPNDGKQVTTLSVATSERWKDQHGEQQERTEWHQVVLFGRVAEVASQYLSKGAPVYIEGKLRTRKWDKDGETRYTTEIIGDQMQMLGSRDGGSSGGSGARRPAPPSRETVKASTEFQAPAGGGFDDDIPFAPMPNV